MKQFYLTSEGHPVETNNPSEPLTLICIKKENEKAKDYKDRSEQEYKQICKQRNDQIEADRIKQEEEMKPALERNRKIQERIRKIAEDQLISEGEISG